MRAQWVLVRNSKGVCLFYDNLITGHHHDCGIQPRFVTDQRVLEWIVEHGGIGVGDLVKLSDGKTFFFQRTPGCWN